MAKTVAANPIQLVDAFIPAVIPPIIQQAPFSPPATLRLRSIQVALMDDLILKIKQGYKQICQCAPTGAGKTIYTAWLIYRLLKKDPNRRILFLVPRITLIQQTVKAFESFGFDVSVLHQNDPRFDITKQVHIGSVDTFSARLRSNNPVISDLFSQMFFSVLIIDECHKQSKAWDKIAHDYRIGLTASPFSNGLGLSFQVLSKPFTMNEVITSGAVRELKMYSSRRGLDTSLMTIGDDGEYDIEQEKLQANELIGNVIEDLQQVDIMKDKRWIGFTRNISICEDIYKRMIEAGLNVCMIHSKKSEKHNRDTIEAFKQGIYDGILSVGMVVEGFDDPTVDMALMLTSFAPHKYEPWRPNNSTGWVQAFGRVRRKSETAQYAIAFDYGNNFARFISPDDLLDSWNHLDVGKRNIDRPLPDTLKEKLLNQKVCFECNHVFHKGNKCPHCGYVLSKGEQEAIATKVTFLTGALDLTNVIKFKGAKVDLHKVFDTPKAKQRFLEGLMAEGFIHYTIASRKYPNRYRPDLNKVVSSMFKQVFGAYPSAFHLTVPSYAVECEELPIATSVYRSLNKKWLDKKKREREEKKKLAELATN